MSGVVWTLLSVLLAASFAGLFGFALGRLGTASSSGIALVNVLTEARGALLPFMLAPVLLSIDVLPEWCALGLVAGVAQGVAVGRWIIRQSSDWAPSLAGGIALGQSGAGLAARSAAARGAVTGTLALGAIQVVTLEALLAWTRGPTSRQPSLGALLVFSGEWRQLGACLLLTLLLLAIEALAARVLQGKFSSSARAPRVARP